MFYNRYVPPSSKVVEEKLEQRPTKKRKKSKQTATELPEHSQVRAESKEKPRKESSSPRGNDIAVDEQDLPLRNRHQTVYSRYEKTKRKVAEKLEVAPPLERETDLEPEIAESHAMDINSHGLEPLPQPAQVAAPEKVSMSSALPEWLRSPTLVSSADAVSFETLPISREIISLLKDKGYEKAFAIQSAMLPMLLPGSQYYPGDLCVSAATGSGKTLAYTLPMIQSLSGKASTRLRGLIVVPTRELVSQVKETLEFFNAGSGVKVGTVVGSRTLKEEQSSLVVKDQRYDPEAYRAEQERTVDEDEEMMDWDFDKRFGLKDDFELLYNHVIEYNSKIDILICTPGRLVEHVQSTTGFSLQHVQWLVIDEADRLLDDSFQQWVDIVLPELEYLPPRDPILERLSNTFHQLRRREIRKIILSATMTRDVSKLTALKLKTPRLVVLEGSGPKLSENLEDVALTEAGDRIGLPRTLHEIGVKVNDTNEKPLYLLQLLEADLGIAFDGPVNGVEEAQDTSDEEDKSSVDSDHSSDVRQDMPSNRCRTSRDEASMKTARQPNTHGTLIFTKTNEHASRLARLLIVLRPAWASQTATLTKSTTSSKGLRTIAAFRKRKLSILVASDRASRGLDIPNLAHVINYDMPPSLTSYIHRVGRTARAGMEGKATTLIADNEARWFWNEIARSEKVGRGPGMKVERANMKLEASEGEKEMYQQALETLGEETRGNYKRTQRMMGS